MLFHSPQKASQTQMKLIGAIRISDHSFFVCKNSDGSVVLKSGNEERAHKEVMQHLININPKIKRLLSALNIKPNIDTKTLKELLKGHMNETCRVAVGIYSCLSQELQSQIDCRQIKEASILHDLGKVLIPAKILNKPSKLSFKERKIMNIHSTLGYELLKTQNIDIDTLDLIKYHHQNLINSGYPVMGSHHPSTLGVQIISTADKYSALKEKRVYRGCLSQKEALLILYREVREGKIAQCIFDALVEYTKQDNAA